MKPDYAPQHEARGVWCSVWPLLWLFVAAWCVGFAAVMDVPPAPPPPICAQAHHVELPPLDFGRDCADCNPRRQRYAL